jgi:hypothetical protein
MQMPEMFAYYHHHTFATILKYKHIIFKPSLWQRITKKALFSWVIIKG